MEFKTISRSERVAMPAGKFRRMLLKDIPSSYLHWVAENWDDDSVATAADEVFRWREKFDRHFEEEEL